MKRGMLFGLLLVLLLLLTGCTGVEERLTEKMVERSGITEDAAYKQYIQYSEDGTLDTNDYYVEQEEEKTERGTIYATFAENSDLSVSYYLTPDCKEKITENSCYLEPGDTLYAVVEVREDAFSSMYDFSEFRVYEYDAEGTGSLSSLGMTETDGIYALTVPGDYEGTEISVVPVGSYEQRTLKLNDYYTDDKGQQIALPGTWEVNEKEYTGDEVKISPVTDYIVSYRFDSTTYFYLPDEASSVFYSSNEDGVVIFNQREAEEETGEYDVELHELLTVTLVSDRQRSVSVNGGMRKTLKANEELTISGLQYGETVTIQTNAEWDGLKNERDLILVSTENISDGAYRYTLTVPEKDGEFWFDPSAYSYEHGTVTFVCFGEPVTTAQMLAKESPIYYYAASADDGYWLSDSGNCIRVSTAEETEAALQAIHFTHKVGVTVVLPRPVGGDVIYKIGEEVLTGETVSTYTGTAITVEFFPWEGWYSDITEKKTYTVSNQKGQCVTADGVDINTIFAEDEAHKPTLKVTLEKSIEETVEFLLEASGYKTEAESYGGGWKLTKVFDKEADKYELFTNKQIIIENEKIGTDEPIRITMGKSAIPAGKAARISITKTDSEGRKTAETRYITSLANGIDPIYIYPEGTNATAKEWYKSIDITIGVVEIETYTPTVSDNAKITVKNANTGVFLESGDLIDGDQTVTVTISPVSGYYVTGNSVTNGVFSKSMTFSQYQADIARLIEDHPVKKYIAVTLDTSDEFAEYTYELSGERVSGTVNIQEGQALSLTYEITGDGYKLEKTGLKLSRTKTTKTLTVTASMDGMTLTRADFGIEVKKEG